MKLHADDKPCSNAKLSPEAVEDVARAKARMALLSRDGRIATLSRGLSKDLGFDRPSDLSGLQISSLWHHDDRAAVARALASARRGDTGQAPVDLSYVHGEPIQAEVTFAPGTAQGSIVMRLDWTNPD